MGRRREDGAPAVGFRVVGGGGFDSGRVTAQSRSVLEFAGEATRGGAGTAAAA